MTLVAIPINTASGIRALDASVVFVGMVVVRTCVFVCVCVYTRDIERRARARAVAFEFGITLECVCYCTQSLRAM
jgi:hypothetical protein